METSFLRYYETELEHLRKRGVEFARAFPRLAGRLDLDTDPRHIPKDPYVERLLEGFAFLSARVHQKLDSEFPRFTQALLQSIFPAFLSPTPCMAILRLGPSYGNDRLPEGPIVKRGTLLQNLVSRAGQPGDTRECTFQTAHDVQLWPIRIEPLRECYVRSGISDMLGSLPEGIRNQAGRPGAAVRLRLRTSDPAIQFGSLPIDRLPVFLRGTASPSLYEHFLARATGVLLRWPEGREWRTKFLPRSCIRPMGFNENEALLPPCRQQFEGYRIIREYAAFPQRFFFVEFAGLQSALAGCHASELELLVLLEAPKGGPAVHDERLQQADSSAFELFCTPAINLFPMECDNVRVSERFSEFQVIPDRGRPSDYEIFDVTGVTGLLAGGREHPFEPFYRLREGEIEARSYFTIHRQRPLTRGSQGPDDASSYPVADVYLSLVDAANAPWPSDLEALQVEARCTNRDTPRPGPSRTHAAFTWDGQDPIDEIRCLEGPSEPGPSPVHGEVLWKAVSHLSLNYLSLLEGPDASLRALKDLLTLYAGHGDVSLNRPIDRQIEGIRSVRAVPVMRRLIAQLHGDVVRDCRAWGEPPGSEAPEQSATTSADEGMVATPFLGRGLEISLDVDESQFEGGTGSFLLGMVLDQFHARHVSINSFTQTVLRSARGEIHRWTPRMGQKATI